MKNRTTLFLKASLALVSVFCVVVFGILTVGTRAIGARAITDLAVIYMSGMSEQIATHFGTTIELRLSQVGALVDAAPPERYDGATAARVALTRSARSRGFSYLAFCGADGEFDMIHCDDGRARPLPDGGRQLLHRPGGGPAHQLPQRHPGPQCGQLHGGLPDHPPGRQRPAGQRPAGGRGELLCAGSPDLPAGRGEGAGAVHHRADGGYGRRRGLHQRDPRVRPAAEPLLHRAAQHGVVPDPPHVLRHPGRDHRQPGGPVDRGLPDCLRADSGGPAAGVLAVLPADAAADPRPGRGPAGRR